MGKCILYCVWIAFLLGILLYFGDWECTLCILTHILFLANSTRCNFAIYCIEMAGKVSAKDPQHLNSIWTLLSLTPRLSSTPPVLTINIIKDMLVMIKAMMVMIQDLPAGTGHYLDLWSHQLTRDVTPPAIDTNPQYSTIQRHTPQYNTLLLLRIADLVFTLTGTILYLVLNSMVTLLGSLVWLLYRVYH